MGIIDWGKRQQDRLIERRCPQPFVFHHIQKCGGTSVGRALRRRYILSQATIRPEPSFSAFKAFTGREDREQMLVDVLDLREQMLLHLMFDGVRGVAAHVRFSTTAHAHFAGTYKFMTVLREPVSRFVSHYFWGARKTGDHARIDEDFECFLEGPRARRLGALMVEYLCGLPKEVPTHTPEAIAAAIANLDRFAIVGDIADTAGLERDIRREFGVKVSIGHENRRNVSGGNRNKILDDPGIRARVEELCAPDIALYEHFKRHRQGKPT